MVQGPHSSGNFNDWTVAIGTLAVKYENLNGCYSTCVTCEVIVDAPQSVESSALRNTFYSKENMYVCMYAKVPKLGLSKL